MAKKQKSRAAKKLPVAENPQLYWVRRPFQYGPKQLDRGLVIRLVGMTNDEKLIRLGFLNPLGGEVETSECGKCNSEFLDSGTRDAHVRRTHAPRGRERVVNIDDLSPSERTRMLSETLQYETEVPGLFGTVDAEAEKEERFLQEVAPLHLDKTEASRT